MPEIPEAWQHAVNHWLDAALAFSGLSLGLGYGTLVLALPLLLLPTAFPELSRPRDALWSLLLAALAPLLLLNPLPVLSSAGFGELIATVLMGRLAAEVGQGRWASLTPDQKWALRHLPRWRRAGADVVAAVVQAAKDTWHATVRAGKTAWGAVSGQPAMGASPGPAADNAPAAEPPQPVAGDDGGQGTEGAEGNLKDGTTAGSGEATPEEGQRARTGLVTSVVQVARNTWRAVSGQKSPVEQRRQRQSAQKTARKEWVRPDPSAEAQGGQDQDGETSPEILDVAPAMATGPDPAVAPDPEPPQPVDGGDHGQVTEGAEANVEDAATGGSGEAMPEQEHPDQPTDGPVTALVEDVTPEEHSAPEPTEELQQAQSLDGGEEGEPGDAKAADAAPADLAPEPEAAESRSRAEPPEPVAQPSEGVGADAVVGPELEPRELAPEEPSAPQPAEEVQQAQAVDGDEEGELGDAKAADAAPADLAPEPEAAESRSRAEPPEPVAQPSEGVGADAVGPELEPREPAPEEPSAPEPAEEVQQAQAVDGGEEGELGDAKAADAAPADLAPEPEAAESRSRAEPPEPVAQPSEGVGADAVGPELEPRELAPEEPSAPEPAEEPQQAQPLGGVGNPAASQAHASPQEAGNSAPVEVVPENNPGEAKAEVKPAQSAGGGSSQPAQDGEEVVVSSFDEIDVKLWSSN